MEFFEAKCQVPIALVYTRLVERPLQLSRFILNSFVCRLALPCSPSPATCTDHCIPGASFFLLSHLSSSSTCSVQIATTAGLLSCSFSIDKSIDSVRQFHPSTRSFPLCPPFVIRSKLSKRTLVSNAFSRLLIIKFSKKSKLYRQFCSRKIPFSSLIKSSNHALSIRDSSRNPSDNRQINKLASLSYQSKLCIQTKHHFFFKHFSVLHFTFTLKRVNRCLPIIS